MRSHAYIVVSAGRVGCSVLIIDQARPQGFVLVQAMYDSGSTCIPPAASQLTGLPMWRAAGIRSLSRRSHKSGQARRAGFPVASCSFPYRDAGLLKMLMTHRYLASPRAISSGSQETFPLLD